jgi:two-component system NtrC family sensor kinase
MAAIAGAMESAGLDYIRADLATLIAESGAGLARVKCIVDDLRECSPVGQNRWQVADLRQSLDRMLNIMAPFPRSPACRWN